MFQIIPKTFAELPQEVIDEEISKIKNKCKVEGKILNVKYLEKDQCFQNIELIVLRGNHSYFKMKSSQLYQECTFDSIYHVYQKNPKGRIEKFISDSNYNIISNNIHDYGKYSIKKCQVNYSQEEYIKEYGTYIQKMNYYVDNHYYLVIGTVFFIMLFIGMFVQKKKIKSRN